MEREIDQMRLVTAAKCGNRDAFGELIGRHMKEMFNVARRITRNREDAEDAVQESFTSVLVHVGSFDGRSRFSTWLTRIAINAALMKLRKNRGLREVPIEEPPELGEAPPHHETKDAAPNPEESYADDERRRILREAIVELRPKLRDTIVCVLSNQEEKMKNEVSQFALALVLAAGFAAPALAQTTNWKLNSDHSTGRLSLSSTADPNTIFDVGIAGVKGTVSLDATSVSNSSFGFIIYPADQDPVTIKADGSLNAAEFSNLPRSTVITFRSKKVKRTGDGDIAVTGDLTITHLERPFTIADNEAYAGPVYGEPEVHSATREVTFVFDHAAAAAAKAGDSRKLKLAASAGINTEDFPGLFEAVTDLNWPVVGEDKDCQMPATIGEEYHGVTCTGTPVVISSRPSASVTVGEDYPGPDLATPRVGDNVKIALTLELTRDASAAAASGN